MSLLSLLNLLGHFKCHQLRLPLDHWMTTTMTMKLMIAKSLSRASNSQKFHVSIYICIYIYHTNHQSFSVKCVYPDEVDEPGLTRLIQEFIYEQHHPNSSARNIPNLPPFYEKITIHTSAVATFHAPSDLSGIGGMKRERIHAVNHWRNGPGRYDTMFINTTHSDTDDNAGSSSAHGFLDLEVARAHLFFSFVHEGVKYPCALVHWFSRPSDVPSDITGMYTLEPDRDRNGQPVTAVIHLDTVFRAAHLLPVFHNHPALSKRQRFEQTLDLFSKFYINHYIDHHAFELVS